MHASSMTDEEVIRLYLASKPDDCFNTLYSRYVKKVYRRCLSLTHHVETAEDFTHDIFIRAFSKLSAFQGRSSFSTWLYAISYNYCISQLERLQRLNHIGLEGMGASVADTSSDDMVEVMYLQLNRAMATLSVDEVTLLKLKYEDDLGIDELARKYNIGSGAVKMRLKRSRDKVRRIYEHMDLN
ncbi:RNA polymerase sigma factor [Spirosoma sp. KUDC1026]|uniref:RNA polymerase sigma factor n=1 Tax=Spirosoma sp. KUDC1026 TaxID=2745947 RepID=UPI00159BD5A2|nr:RNA polymerase sigma factor [Spirosoma sp. KUDC1026]QKZ13371.1 RNA polymerase sigma factor [Spirosoma sp. KUDC1026]